MSAFDDFQQLALRFSDPVQRRHSAGSVSCSITPRWSSGSSKRRC